MVRNDQDYGADALVRCAKAQLARGDHAGARQYAVLALAKADLPPHSLDELVAIFQALVDFRRACDACQRLAAAVPGNDVVLSNLGALQFRCGDCDAAEHAFKLAIARNPRNVEALSNLSELRPASDGDNVIAAVEARLAGETDPHCLAKLHHALAREYEALGRLDLAFANFAAAKSAFRAACSYREADDRSLFAALQRFIVTDIDGVAAAPADGPIFVVGLPRSGTTIVERILTNGEGVFALGESLVLPNLVRRLAGDGPGRLVKAETVAQRWPHLPLSVLADSYRTYARSLSGGAPRTLDKLPLNLLLAPLIVRALPGARIICISRNAIDAVLSNYRHLFETRSGTYGYTSSLSATAEFVAESMRLTETLAARYSDRVCHVRYEELVAGPEHGARAIAEFCGVPWNGRLHEIDHNHAPAASSSAVQVRAPIHDGYVGRWRHYRPWLRDAIAVLDRYGLSGQTEAGK